MVLQKGAGSNTQSRILLLEHGCDQCWHQHSQMCWYERRIRQMHTCSEEGLEDLASLHRRFGAGSVSAFDEDAKYSRPRKPSFRTANKQEKIAPQKWVQCAKCELWRKVNIIYSLQLWRSCPLSRCWPNMLTSITWQQLSSPLHIGVNGSSSLLLCI